MGEIEHVMTGSAPAVLADYAAVVLPGEGAAAADWAAALDQVEAIAARAYGAKCRLMRDAYADLRDTAAMDALQAWTRDVDPLVDAEEARLRTAILAARADVAAVTGPWYAQRLELTALWRDPALSAARVQEAALVARYDQLMSGSAYVAGHAVSPAEAMAMLDDPDPTTRHDAWAGRAGHLAERRDEFNRLFDDLLALRQEMARIVGQTSYLDLADAERGRVGYGADTVAGFRAAVLEHIVPLCASVRDAAAVVGGHAELPPWDVYHVPGARPAGQDRAAIVDLGKRAIVALHPDFAAHVAALEAAGTLDVTPRPGKLTMPFALYIPDTGDVVVSTTVAGREIELFNLVHELGHAIQLRESHALRLPLREMTYDMIEVPSTAMEHMVAATIADLVPERGAWLRRRRFVDTLQRLSTWSAIDEFQRWVYATPGHSHAERDAVWLAIWDRYVVGLARQDDRTYDELLWGRLRHVFAMPGYAIDYALAEVVALQYGAWLGTDREAAVASYMRLAKLGGSMPMGETLAAVGLADPFDPATVARTAKILALGLQ